jgi:glycerol-1-phosphatase
MLTVTPTPTNGWRDCVTDMVKQLIDGYDALLLDLDGVVYAGGHALPHAPEMLDLARNTVRLAFVTNNASRTPQQVADMLSTMGIHAIPEDVVTSAQAGSRLLVERGHQPGSSVLVVGGDGLRAAVSDRGFDIVSDAADRPVAVIQGFSPDVDWRALAEATFALRAGADYVATNTDLTIPTGRGIAPGNGLLVQAVATASGVTPVVAGKPETPLMVESVQRVRATRPLVVGDRLDTDIAGAVRAGIDSVLVFTGVTDVAGLIAAAPDMRPTYVAADLRGLFAAPVQLAAPDSGALEGSPTEQWLRTVARTCAQSWDAWPVDDETLAETVASIGRLPE